MSSGLHVWEVRYQMGPYGSVTYVTSWEDLPDDVVIARAYRRLKGHLTTPDPGNLGMAAFTWEVRSHRIESDGEA